MDENLLEADVRPAHQGYGRLAEGIRRGGKTLVNRAWSGPLLARAILAPCYRFAAAAEEKVYNPTLALYFFDHLQREGAYPPQMLDANLAADEAKLRFLAHGTASGELLAETLQSGVPIEGHLEDRFLYSDFVTRGRRKRSSLASFLFYFGMLTIEGTTPRRTLRLAPPNLVIRKLYVEEMLSWLLRGEEESPDLETPTWALLSRGEIEPLLTLIEDKLLPRFSARDRRWMNELAVKTAFTTLLFQDVVAREVEGD